MKKTCTRDVFLYIPNIIGYGRVICTLTSIVLMILVPAQWKLAVGLYISSFVGDLFDGMVARILNQSSRFGGMLDMITDRCSTLGLFFVLATEYGLDRQVRLLQGKNYGGLLPLIFTLLAILDISSHWAQMYSTASLNIHHKSQEANEKRFFLVRLFYSNYPFFGYCCVGAEFTYITLYVLAHAQPNGILYQISSLAFTFFLPACIMKQIVNLFQLTAACQAVAEHDATLKNLEKN